LDESLQLSIIIVNHRAEAILPQCLEAIAAAKSSLNVEVIIVDNPEDAKSGQVEIPDGLNLRRIALPRRTGFGAACNRGAKEAGGDCLLFLNPDVIVEADAIDHLYKDLDSLPDAGMVVGRLVGRDGEFQPSCRRFPTLGNLFLSRGSFLQKIFRFREDAYTLPDYQDITQVDAAAAAMMMMSKATFDRIQGFDERFFLYMEDTDLCYRATQAGYKLYYIPQAGGRHFWGYSTRQYRFKRIWWHHLSIWRYFVKHYRSIGGLAFLAAMLLINSFLSLIVELFTLRK